MVPYTVHWIPKINKNSHHPLLLLLQNAKGGILVNIRFGEFNIMEAHSDSQKVSLIIVQVLWQVTTQYLSGRPVKECRLLLLSSASCFCPVGGGKFHLLPPCNKVKGAILLCKCWNIWLSQNTWKMISELYTLFFEAFINSTENNID